MYIRINILKTYICSIKPVLLILLRFEGLSISLEYINKLIRKYVYKDSHDLDTVFDAGGKVTFDLTVVTVTVMAI